MTHNYVRTYDIIELFTDRDAPVVKLTM